MFIRPTAPSTMKPKTEPTAAKPMPVDDQRLWATVGHMSGFLLGPAGAGFWFWLLRDRGESLRTHLAAAVNYQLSLLVYWSVLAAAATFAGLHGYAFVITVVFLMIRTVGAVLHTVRAKRGTDPKLWWIVKTVR